MTPFCFIVLAKKTIVLIVIIMIKMKKENICIYIYNLDELNTLLNSHIKIALTPLHCCFFSFFSSSLYNQTNNTNNS